MEAEAPNSARVLTPRGGSRDHCVVGGGFGRECLAFRPLREPPLHNPLDCLQICLDAALEDHSQDRRRRRSVDDPVTGPHTGQPRPVQHAAAPARVGWGQRALVTRRVDDGAAECRPCALPGSIVMA